MSPLAILKAILIFAAWETALGAAAARAASWLGWSGRDEPSPGEAFLAWLALDIVLACGAASLVSFARLNSQAAYAAVGAVFAAVGFARSGSVRTFFRLPVFQDARVWAALAALWVPVWAVALRPVDEIDSLNYLHFMLEWMANRATPYAFSTGYVAFWESGFVPGWVLTRTDLFFPLVALKSVLLVAAALYVAGFELGLPRRLLLWTVAGTAALRFFWLDHSGVPTLKNDALHAAGAVMMCVALLRAAKGRWTRGEAVLLTLGVTFASVKYSGVFLALPVLAGVAFLVRPRRVAPVLAGFAFWLAACGHYYVRTAIQHGNPFFPFQVNFAGIHLPGLADLSNTSILGSLHKPEIWRLLFLPAGGVSPAGLLFPVVLAVLPVAVGWAMLTGLRKRPQPEWWLAAFLAAGWLLYARSFYSAGGDDLRFLRASLNSLRYVEGELGLSELFLVWMLWRSRAPRWVPYAAAGLSLASRLAILYGGVPADAYKPWALAAVAAVAGLAALRWPRGFAAAGSVALLGACPWLVEQNRARRQFWWQDIYRPVASLRPSSIYLIDDPRTGYCAGHALLAGNPLRHDVRCGPEGAARGARYMAHLFTPDLPDVPRELSTFAGAYAAQGYRPAIQGRYGAVLEHFDRAALSGESTAAWYVPPDLAVDTGLAVDEGGLARVEHRLRAGEAAFTPEIGRLIRLGAGGNTLLEAAEGARAIARNCGTPDAGGLAYAFHDGRWIPDLSAAPRLNRDFDPSVSRGAFSVERLSDASGPFLRVTAREDSQWLVAIGRFPKGVPDGSPLTARAEVRCPAPVPCLLWFWRIEKTGKWTGETDGAWHAMRWMDRPRGLKPSDYYAVGREAVKSGEYFDVRELSLMEGYYP